MRQTQDRKAQIEFIIQEQITCMRLRTKSCERIFNHTDYDRYTAEYNRLEGELKKLTRPTTAPTQEMATPPIESISPRPVPEETPTQEIVAVIAELS